MKISYYRIHSGEKCPEESYHRETYEAVYRFLRYEIGYGGIISEYTVSKEDGMVEKMEAVTRAFSAEDHTSLFAENKEEREIMTLLCVAYTRATSDKEMAKQIENALDKLPDKRVLYLVHVAPILVGQGIVSYMLNSLLPDELRDISGSLQDKIDALRGIQDGSFSLEEAVLLLR